MTLVGVLDTMGGFYTIRGFAKLADIAKVSKPEEYQRELIEEHKREIKEFYRKGSWLFFPELVLGHTLKYDFEQEGAETGINPLRDITIEHKGFESNIEKIKYTPYRTAVGEQQLYKIVLNDGWLDEIVERDRPFARIDGNHRIEAYRALMDEGGHSGFEDYRVPFSLVLFADNDDSKRNQKVIFHNINARARPLTTEEELRGIVADGSFSEIELRENFGEIYPILSRCYRELNGEISRMFPYLGTSLSRKPITVLKKTMEMLSNRGVSPLNTEIVITSLQELNRIFGNYRADLPEPIPEVIMVALYIEILGENSTELFVKWVIENHINDLRDIDPISLLSIYKKVRESKKRQIFVSMQFDDASLPHYEAIKKAVDEINSEYNLQIKIREIRIDEFNQGHSYKIDDAILELIEESGLLIADLSSKNINVYQELGYLMGLNQGKKLRQENFILIFKEDETTRDNDVGFNIRPYQQLRFREQLELVEKLKSSIKIYYNLGE